jgi:hypothetical protein
MVQNGYTEYNTPAVLQRGQMIDIYIFVLFCSSPLTAVLLINFYMEPSEIHNTQIPGG